MEHYYRNCICGRRIPAKHYLCRECRDIYGSRDEWPEWLKFYVADMKREEDCETNTRERHYDAVAERVVQRPRQSLRDAFDENGIVVLRFD